MKKLRIPTARGTVLDGVLFSQGASDTVLSAITGIHGNFYSNPFYYNIGHTLAAHGMDFIYAQTTDAFGEIETENRRTGKKEIVGSWNEDFRNTDEDIEGYLAYAQQHGYQHIILAGHSLGANKVIYYLSRHPEAPIDHFLLLSPANLEHLTSVVTDRQKALIRMAKATGQGGKLLPFELLGWITCTVDTAYQWAIDNILDNVHVEPEKDFSQVERIQQSGAMIIGTWDNFTYGDPAGYLRTINAHMQTAKENKLVFIEKTGHQYHRKEQELADRILELMEGWKEEAA